MDLGVLPPKIYQLLISSKYVNEDNQGFTHCNSSNLYSNSTCCTNSSQIRRKEALREQREREDVFLS